MGLFLQAAIMPGCKEQEARNIVRTVAEKYSCSYDEQNTENTRKYDITDLIPDQCQYEEHANGVSILFNEECIGYEYLAEAITNEFGKIILLLYIYDGDYWAYILYDNGKVMDQFNPMPDYFEEVSEEEIQKSKGNAEIIAKYFHIEKDSIENYLVRWSDDTMDEKAYEDDEFGYEDWQMADFMRKLGYTYEFGEE